jgi:hypothetical protein
MSARRLVYTTLAGAGLGIAAASLSHHPIYALYATGLVLAGVAVHQWSVAEDESEREFFADLAPRLGLEYVVSGALPPITPLLSAGDSQLCEHVMEGPLFGKLGGPTCTLAHYQFSVTHADGEHGTRQVPHHFTVGAMELPDALPVFHGIYLRRRPAIRIPGLWDDWLARAHAAEVDLESADFEQLYELRAAPDQDPLVLQRLFSPSFIVWLAEHPLRPGLECKAGELVVFMPEHEGDADRLTLFHEATREIARRVMATVESRSLTPAA